MQMFEYKCKNCGANLQLDLDNLQGYCQHCGNAVMIESATLSQLMMEREKTRQIKMHHEHEERMYEKKIEAERREKRAEGIKSFLHSDTAKMIMLPFLMMLCFAPLIIWGIISSISSAFTVYELPYSDGDVMGKKFSTVKESFREAGFTNISVDYTTNSYGGVISEGDVAEVTVNGKDVYKKGDKYKKNANAKIVIVIYTPDGKIALPYSNETVLGQRIYGVEDQLEDMGFTNVQRSEKKSLATFIGAQASYTVVRMLVNGEETFNIGDRFAPDVSIVLEYYD